MKIYHTVTLKRPELATSGFWFVWFSVAGSHKLAREWLVFWDKRKIFLDF